MYAYDGSQWVKASAATQQTIVTYKYTATSGQTTFSGSDLSGLSLSYTAGLINVYFNGVLLVPGDDFTATNGTSVVLASGAVSGDSLSVVAFTSFNAANNYTSAQVDALFATQANVDNAVMNPFLLMGA
jgi:hypothetical protein